jgi:hypothetical protein
LYAEYNYKDKGKEDELGRVCSMHEKWNACRILMRRPETKYHKDDLDAGGRIILK